MSYLKEVPRASLLHFNASTPEDPRAHPAAERWADPDDLVPRRPTGRSLLLPWHLLLGDLSLGHLLLLSLLLLVLSVDVATLGPSCTNRHLVSKSIQQLLFATKIVREKSDQYTARGRLTLLRDGTVVHRSCLGWISATAVLLLLSSVHLRVSSHRVSLLRMSIGHLRHAGVLHATVAAAHPKTAHHSAASGRVAASGTVVRCLVDANGATVESECRALASVQNKLRVLRRSQNLLWWVLLDVVHRGDGSLRVVLVRVPNESEATAAAGVTILNHNLRDGAASRQ